MTDDETKQPTTAAGDADAAAETVPVLGAVGAATDATPESAEPIAVSSDVTEIPVESAEVEPVTASAPVEPITARVEPIDAVPVAAVTTRTVRTRKERPVPAPAPIASSPSGPYAVIETGGKQYRVRVGDAVSVERLYAEAGSDVTIDRVLLVGGTGATRVGTPVVDGATVTARIDDHVRGEKIVVFKYKPKKRYRRKMGHRQALTKMTITAISG